MYVNIHDIHSWITFPGFNVYPNNLGVFLGNYLKTLIFQSMSIEYWHNIHFDDKTDQWWMCHRLHTYRPLSKLCFTTVEKKQRTNVYSTVYLSRVRCCTAEQLSVAAAECIQERWQKVGRRLGPTLKLSVLLSTRIRSHLLRLIHHNNTIHPMTR